jgi:hypothetical protein
MMNATTYMLHITIVYYNITQFKAELSHDLKSHLYLSSFISGVHAQPVVSHQHT